MRRKHLHFVLILALFNSFASAQAPTATIIMPSGVLCTDVPHTFSCITTGSITAYSWSLSPTSGHTLMPNNFSSSVSITFTSAITYSLTLFVANGSGTFATGGFVTVSKTPNASYRAELSNKGFPAFLQLVNYSTNYSSLNWEFYGAAGTNTGEVVQQAYNTPGNYTVSLIAFGSNGCNDTLDYNFVIDDVSDVKLVNIFTPNSDGVNDVFKPITKGLSELRVWIYNRWGVLMYGWSSLGGSWDGYTTSGIMCVDGVYFYVLEAKGFDGKEYKLKSNLTLTR
ncbi:MAG: gliding motility-associated C-terminal domain-containing protein [Bacteroidota bacterium]|nr:gliding motility-associated C-terminal domain-containing protein [Bacteroidota bacterium]